MLTIKSNLFGPGRIFALLFLVLSTGFFNSCEKAKSEKVVLVRITAKGEIKFEKSEALIKKTMENYFGGGTIIDSIKLIKGESETNKVAYYILGKGHSGVNSRVIAMYLEVKETASDGSLILVMTGDGDTCNGNPCNECELKGKIGKQRCECNGTGPNGEPGFCNHNTGVDILWNTSPLEDIQD